MDELANLQLHKEFGDELTALTESGAALPFVLAPAEAFMLLSGLQLVLKHPALSGSGRAGPALPEFLRALALNIQDRLCVTPALKRVAEMGWEDGEPVTAPLAIATCEYEA